MTIEFSGNDQFDKGNDDELSEKSPNQFANRNCQLTKQSIGQNWAKW